VEVVGTDPDVGDVMTVNMVVADVTSDAVFVRVQ
jgi:hypothetical protein